MTSLAVFGTTVAAVAASAVIAALEGNWNTGAVTMGFRSHAGMWGDLVLMPLLNALVVPRMLRQRPKASCVLPAWAIVAIALISVAVTVTAHAMWSEAGRIAGTTDHVFPTHDTGSWYFDLSLAGWAHVAFMSVELAIVLLYAAIAMPRPIVVAASFVLSVHLPFALLGPKIASGNSLMSPDLLLLPAGLMAIWLVAVAKLRSQSYES